MNPSEDDADGGTNLNKVGSIDSEGRGRGLRSLSRERAKEAIIPGINLEEELPPPLPPRPSNPSSFETPPSTLLGSLRHSNKSLRPQLQSTSTTAVSLTDIHAHTIQNGSQETFASISEREHSKGSPALNNSFGRHHSRSGSEADESGSVKSYVPTIEVHGDVESLLGDVLGGEESPAWKLLSSHGEGPDPFDLLEQDEGAITVDFSHEFGELDEVSEDGDNEEALITQWRSKRKHFLILSSAGKPIYNRHGDDNLISSYIGVIQTIISFYQSASDSLKGFTAGGVRFVIMIQGPLYLVAISRLAESDAQLRVQLEALYMQILSTLTLPTLTQLFSNRPSTDLRRPLQGTEPLLSALADSFTRGSPPTLLSALECLKLRKSHRQVIDNTLLKVRSDNLLYGLIVAGGRLVSVVRPKRHSLHPGDLQLIFNMLFEAGGVKAGGGESWIPLCLPGFNKNGYLYMFVSFLSSRKDDEAARTSPSDNAEKEDEVVVLLISAKKESFFDLRKMRDELVDQLKKNGSMAAISSAVRKGRPATTDIIPGTVVRHFLYKSRGNVQFAMPSYEPHFTTLPMRRRLLSSYHTLHASVHAKNAHLKVHHCMSRESTSLAWLTPVFELYCIAGPHASRNALAQSANKIVQWVRREEERIFIIGGAVF